ncbi:MAG: hypothetical protein JWN57_766, partial [Frankiales bacterium]|nr:hypothetical protein [Frankiales bacterium]
VAVDDADVDGSAAHVPADQLAAPARGGSQAINTEKGR